MFSFCFRNNSVPPIFQLLIALRYYATGSQLLAIADIAGVSISTCSRVVKRVSEAVVTLRTEFIKFPETQEDLNKVKTDFYNIARFPNVVGCLDCSHIKIQSPGNTKEYSIHKYFYSLKLVLTNRSNRKLCYI